MLENITIVKGNHHRMFHYFMQSPSCDNLCFNVGYHWLHKALVRREIMASNGVAVEEIMRLKEVLKRTLDMAPAARVTFLRSLPLFHQTSEIFSPLRVYAQLYRCLRQKRIIYFGFDNNYLIVLIDIPNLSLSHNLQ